MIAIYNLHNLSHKLTLLLLVASILKVALYSNLRPFQRVLEKSSNSCILYYMIIYISLKVLSVGPQVWEGESGIVIFYF